jgi:hypothetical protein
MKRSIIKICLIILAFGLAGSASAQKRRKTERFLDVSVSPSLTFRVMGKYVVPDSYYGTLAEYGDSLNKADRPGQNINLGIEHVWKKNAFDAFSVGLSYTSMSFRRIKNDVRIGDTIHPEVGIVAGVIQAGFLQVKYDYRYRYLEIPFLWHRSAEGYGNLRDFDLWYTYGVAPAVLLQDRVHIRTVGFSHNGEITFDVQDKNIVSTKVNVIGHAGFRAQYHLYHKVHGLVQPRVRIPLLPAARGQQTFWLPQFSLDIGLIYLIDKEKDKNK